MRAGRRRLAGAVVVGLAAVALSGSLLVTRSTPLDPDVGGWSVLVVDEGGRPIAGAMAQVGSASGTSTVDGRLRLPITAPTLVQVSARGHLSRVVAADPRVPSQVELTTAGTTGISLRFGGDVMVGRRFFEKGDGRSALLTQASTAAETQKLFGAVGPLLADADLTVVNLETPLMSDPYYDPDGPRPSRFHPTKGLAFASPLPLAAALSGLGVDAVSLANNHAFDGLEAGLASTVAALDAAGVAHFGAGVDEAHAWAPAYLVRHGQRVALLGCTTVTGESQTIPYVAGPHRAGAARCAPTTLTQAVRDARAHADIVAVMLHGAIEYQRDQTPLIRALMADARAAGAAVVVTSHPHVVGGVTADHGAVLAESMGNLIFDQQLWQTFASYLLRVDLAEGRPVFASVDPLVVDDFRPRPTIGRLAQAAARIAAGTIDGAGRLTTTGATVALGAAGGQPGPGVVRQVTLGAGEVRTLGAGWWVSGTALPAQVRLGTDLLYGTGDLESADTDRATGRGRLWEFGLNAATTEEATCSGTVGARLLRSPVSTEDVYLTPAHRVPVVAGTSVSVVVSVRSASAGGRVELHWYRSAEGDSSGTVVAPIPQGDWSGCRQVRLDAVVPTGVVAAAPFVRLAPPNSEQSAAHAYVDDIRLVEWAPAGTGGRRYDTVSSPAQVTVTASADDASAAMSGAPLPLLPPSATP